MGQTFGGIYLTTDGVKYDPHNNMLNSFSNDGTKRRPMPHDPRQVRTVLTIGFHEIKRAEVGSFKALWKNATTLRLYMKNGEVHYFTMPKKETALNWMYAINARLI